MKKRVVINTSTIRVGGAVQVAINVIKQSFKENDLDVYYVTNQILNSLIDTDKSRTLVVNDFPSSVFAFKTKKQIKNFVDFIQADMVYSVGAPSYIKFNCKEVLRLTNPWLIENNILAFRRLSILRKLRTILEINVKRLYLRNVEYFITQTEDAQRKIVINLNKEDRNVYVIQNVYSYNFEKYIKENFRREYNGVKNIICVSANYSHKNIILLVHVATLMKRKGLKKYMFFLTIPTNDWEGCKEKTLIDHNDVSSYFTNLGKLTLDELVGEYKRSHIFILPTLLEVYSVSFLEAMIFDLPIITTDFSFNRDICKDAAFYIKDPFNAAELLKLIEFVSNSEKERNVKIERGKALVSELPTNNNVYAQHFDVLKEILEY